MANLVKEVTQRDLVVVEQDFLLGGEKPLAERQAGSRYGGGVVLHIQLVGELVGSELSHWKRKRQSEEVMFAPHREKSFEGKWRKYSETFLDVALRTIPLQMQLPTFTPFWSRMFQQDSGSFATHPEYKIYKNLVFFSFLINNKQLNCFHLFVSH